MIDAKQKPLAEKLEEIYSVSGPISTVCCRQCGCCRVACPQMKYSEALRIVSKIWNTWPAAEKKELLVRSVEYFFSKSLIKSCPMLAGEVCKVYNDRPLNCRLYGLWPADTWEKRVDGFSRRLGLPRDMIPLNSQCEFVELAMVKCPDCDETGDGQNGGICQTCGGQRKIKPSPLTDQKIQNMFDLLDQLDVQILSDGATEGMKKKTAEGRVKSNWNYRTIHDWILFFFWGEDKLSQMTEVIMVASQEQLDGLLETFRGLIPQADLSHNIATGEGQ